VGDCDEIDIDMEKPDGSGTDGAGGTVDDTAVPCVPTLSGRLPVPSIAAIVSHRVDVPAIGSARPTRSQV
jgi:hypothetical protein